MACAVLSLKSFRSGGHAAGRPAAVRQGGAAHRVEVVNLTGGGAVVSGSFPARLGERVDLNLGGAILPGVVRMLRGNRIGLELIGGAADHSPWDLPSR